MAAELQLLVLVTAISFLLPSSMAQCQFDQRCFRYSVGCTLAYAYPYDRRTPCSCTECLNRCLLHGPGKCRSVVYDAVYRSCDLFAVNAMFPPQRLMKWRGRCYFQPTGLCQIEKPAPPPAPAKSCPEGQTAKLVAIKDYQLPGFSGTTVPNVDQKGCEQACMKNQLPDGKPIDCKAAQFGGNQCVLGTTAGSSVEGTITAASGTTFYQKLCFPSSLVENCPDVFEEDPQKILVGQNKQTVDASSLQDCLQKCLDSQKNFGFGCKSGMFYYQDAQLNCILNIESKSTKPDLFVDAPPSDKVTYFEPGCNGGQKMPILAFKAAKSMKKSSLVKDQPLKGQWTMWSTCTKDNKQYRFMPCDKSDPRQCEKEERRCGDSTKEEEEEDEAWFKQGSMTKEDNMKIHDGNATSSFTPCQSLFRNGNKNCTFGAQIVDGDIIYCTNPVDC